MCSEAMQGYEVKPAYVLSLIHFMAPVFLITVGNKQSNWE